VSVVCVVYGCEWGVYGVWCMCVSGMCMGMCGVWVCERSVCGICV